ncbi:ImmA/IrrE family metallo-endopeptidase [Haloferula sp. A504]|uniref:ImmA/IrrE family metallo-endopeptidase n=1 Tax=Haloferula sp. A504 TaxID=3373601 RepID=UPI0031C08458|nr:ImmA/IrrE family metallo-endopeptidase [Verrucomicrobiaceae bacterium E54]
MKPINTPKRHEEALERFDVLVARGVELTEPERDELEILSVLLADYEEKHHPVPPPDPIEAIKFRMMQCDYKAKDLGRLVGGANRASEILSGKRGLTPDMMRALYREWGIPTDSLLGVAVPEPEPAPEREFDPGDYPIKQMYDRGYFPGRERNWKRDSRDKPDLLRRFFTVGTAPLVPALPRKATGKKAINVHALEAWAHRVRTRVAEEEDLPKWDRKAFDGAFVHWLASLSYFDDGLVKAIDELRERGLPVVVEPRLDGTRLDGAALLADDGRPIIGLTLRLDRLDNFWFTLFHELGHVLNHLDPGGRPLFDCDFDSARSGRVEQEADRFALDTLIPPPKWEVVRTLKLAGQIRRAARDLRIGVAVIAGRLRREANDYRKHRTLVGQGMAREALGFTDDQWPK